MSLCGKPWVGPSAPSVILCLVFVLIFAGVLVVARFASFYSASLFRWSSEGFIGFRRSCFDNLTLHKKKIYVGSFTITSKCAVVRYVIFLSSHNECVYSIISFNAVLSLPNRKSSAPVLTSWQLHI